MRKEQFSTLAAAFLAVSLVFTTNLRGAISVGLTGAGPLTFDNYPAGADFLTAYFGGSGTSFAATGTVDGAVQTIAASAFLPTFTLVSTTNFPPPTYAYGFVYNSNATGRFLYSRATTVSGTNANQSAAVLMLTTFQNNSGVGIQGLRLSFDTTTNNYVSGELPGLRVYYSLTGATGSWVNIPEFSGKEMNATLVADLTFASAWPSGASMYLFWFDDNANSITDPSYTIDNLLVTNVVQVGNVAPQITNDSSVTNRTVTQCRTTSMSVTASGVPLPGYQWYRDNSPVPGATNATFTIASMTSGDAGSYFVEVCNSQGCVRSRTNQIAYVDDTSPPTVLSAYGDLSLTNITVTFDEPIDMIILNEITFSWTVEPVSGPGVGNLIIENGAALNSSTISLHVSARDPDTAYRVVINYVTDACVGHEIPLGTIVPLTREAIVVNYGATWHYLDNDIDPGPSWYNNDFDDSAWATGAGPFDAKRNANGAAGAHCRDTSLYGLGAVGSCINITSPVTGTNLITAYFRTAFSFGGDPGTARLRLRGKFDDGAVIYLNGEELQRVGMPLAPAVITATNFATRGVNDGDALDVFEYVAPPSLQNGNNVIAVEVHQANATSSDLTMGLQVITISSSASSVAPQLRMEISGGNITITWSPASGVLQSENALDGSWDDVSPQPPPGGPYVTPASGAMRFFRTRP
jgi:hypothetical protein